MCYTSMTENEFRKIIPIGEIQKYDGNCWAATLSMLMRCHGFDVSQNAVTSLFQEWKYDGITSKQMSELVGYFNKKLLEKQSYVMKTTSGWKPLLSYIGNSIPAPVQVFITGHFVLLLGYDSANSTITYFDPWDGSVHEVSEDSFAKLGGGETVYIHKI